MLEAYRLVAGLRVVAELLEGREEGDILVVVMLEVGTLVEAFVEVVGLVEVLVEVYKQQVMVVGVSRESE